jgi:hypothetical protein
VSLNPVLQNFSYTKRSHSVPMELFVCGSEDGRMYLHDAADGELFALWTAYKDNGVALVEYFPLLSLNRFVLLFLFFFFLF